MSADISRPISLFRRVTEGQEVAVRNFFLFTHYFVYCKELECDIVMLCASCTAPPTPSARRSIEALPDTN